MRIGSPQGDALWARALLFCTFASCCVLAKEGVVAAEAVGFLIDPWEEVWHTEWGRRQSVPWPNGKKIFSFVCLDFN